MSEKVEYEKVKVELSRKYPFGETKTIDLGKGKTKEVTVVTCNELNGFDDENVVKAEQDGKVGGYAQIAISIGEEYQTVLQLANKDRDVLLATLMGF